jgi:prolyl-tRNA synthetase
MTNAEMFDAIKFEGEYSSAILAKQLYMWDKKNKEKTWLICAEVNCAVDLKAVAKSIGVKPDNFRAAEADALYKFLGCKKGMVNFFSIVNDVENKVVVLYDKNLYEGKWQSFHPMDNHASICINKDGVNKIKELTGRDDTNF